MKGSEGRWKKNRRDKEKYERKGVKREHIRENESKERREDREGKEEERERSMY